MNHHATWGHPPRKQRRNPAPVLACLVGLLIAVGVAVLIAGGR